MLILYVHIYMCVCCVHARLVRARGHRVHVQRRDDERLVDEPLEAKARHRREEPDLDLVLALLHRPGGMGRSPL